MSLLRRNGDREWRQSALVVRETVRDWSEQARYKLNISKEEALQLYSAITTRRSGIMPWLRNHW